MFNLKRTVLALGLALGSATAALAGGYWTNGIQTICPLADGCTFTQLLGGELHPVDTQLSGGRAPQSVAATSFQQAAMAISAAANTGTTSSGAVTLSTKMGFITTESISTAIGATYTVTLTNTTVAASSTVDVGGMFPKSDVTAARFAIQSITPASGSVVIVFKNVGTAAASGTWTFAFQVR